MKNNQKMLITFDELSVELSKAIKKNDYNSVRMVAEKQNDFMQRVKGIMTNNFDPDFDKSWTISLKKHKGMIKIIENDLKDLNSKTKKLLQQLKGYLR
ncbi:MAG: hypothetical protein CM15mP117_19120 [Alphaproteobacteria bacterium]|nr:MAG: hypothetical protein CM15mP117_19120 [Alphaproteobacteria bacterium]